MKCKIFKLCLFIFSCFVPTFWSFAETANKPTLEPGTKDDKGCYSSGVLYNVSNLESDWNWKYTVSGSNLYLVSDSDNTVLYLYGDNISVQAFKSDDHVVYEKWQQPYSHKSGGDIYKESDKNRRHYYSSLPVFDKTKSDFKESVKKYLESGDTSGCENSNDIAADDIDGSIEVPHGLKISGEFSFGTIQKVFHDKLLSFGWTLPEMEELTYDAQFKFNYLDKKQNSNGIDSGWYNWRDNIKYNYDSAAMILDVVNKNQGVNWLASARTSLGLSMDDCYSITFRVRNRKGDKVSNWVEIQLGQDGKATARETDLNGNTQKSDEYNEDTNPSTNDSNPGSNEFYDWVKDKTDNSTNKDSDSTTNGLSSSVSDLKTFITSGFGLLGSNGIIALMSGLFSYIPASVWTLIKSAIAMTILIMLIGLIKNLVFG